MPKEVVDLALLRVLQTLLTECSVSRTAERLGQSQPAVSVALRRLRVLMGDPLLVRSGNRMVITSRGLELLEPIERTLAGIEQILHPSERFDPATTTRTFRIATPDYLDVFFVPAIVDEFSRAAPCATLEFTLLLVNGGYESGLESGFLDLVIGNWQTPPEHLHLQRLCEDEMVCLLRLEHPVKRGRLTRDVYGACNHLAVTTHSLTGPGTIDVELGRHEMRRRITTRLPYFGLAPYVLVKSDLIFTTTRSFARHYARLLPLRIEPVPVPVQKLSYYQLWHERTHRSPAIKWLRSLIANVASALTSD